MTTNRLRLVGRSPRAEPLAKTHDGRDVWSFTVMTGKGDGDRHRVVCFDDLARRGAAEYRPGATARVTGSLVYRKLPANGAIMRMAEILASAVSFDVDGVDQ